MADGPDAEYSPYLAVKLEGVEVPAMLDSGNTYANVISDAMFATLGLEDSDLRPPDVKKVATAKAGAQLTVLGQVKRRLKLKIPALGCSFTIRPMVVKGLSMKLNLCGPFLQKKGLNQIHGRNSVEYQGRTTQCAHPQPAANAAAAVYVKKDTRIEPKTLCFLTLRAPELANDSEVQEGLVEGSGAFMAKTDLHPWVGAMVDIEPGGQVVAGVMNTSDQPVLLHADTRYGTLTKCGTMAQWQKDPDTVCAITAPCAEAASAETPQETDPRTRKEKVQWLTEQFKLNESPFLKSASNMQRAVQLLLDHWEAFSIHGEYGTTDLVEHEIHTAPGPPVKQKYRPPNPALEDTLHQQLADWKEKGVIEPAQSPWSFSLVAVPKKNGKIRWCVDYRGLNARTLRDQYPLPNINDNLNKLARSKIFSGIDGCGAYHVVPIAKKDRAKTAFATPEGAFQFARMPFGLQNAPATYSRLVQMVLEGIPYSMAIPYLDDTCVHGRDFDTHLQALERVLKAHIRAGLKLQPAKCQLFRDEIEYLGFMVSGKGLYPVARYLRVVKEWPVPRTRTEARAFLGKVGYYRRFIQDFSAIAKPWTDVTGHADPALEKQPLDVTPAMEEAFERLKHCLMTAPVLAYPRFDSKEPFILDTDWSQDHATVGAVLSQKQDGKERVICYGSKKMPKSRTNYAPTRGELYAVIHFIKEFEYYLRFRPFILRTDHAALKWIYTMEKPTGMIERWLQTLANHQFTVEYRPGKNHQNADALSRIAHADPPDAEDDEEAEDPGINALQLMTTVAALVKPHPWTRQEVHHAQGANDEWRRLAEWAKLGVPPSPLERKALSLDGQAMVGFLPQLYVSRDGLLHRRPPTTEDRPKRPPQLCLPPALWEEAIAALHAAGGHMGRDATLHRLLEVVFFPSMKKRVEEFIRRCPNCQTKERRVAEQRHTLVSQPAGYPFQKLAIDFVGPLKASSRGNKYLLTVKCTFTKWFEAFPMPEATAERVAATLETEVFARYGYCEQIHSDQGSQFTGHLFKAVGDLLGVQITTTPAYNPKSNPVERSHRDLGAILRALIGDSDRTWEEVLPQALFAMRTTPCRSTGLTPFQLMFGREASQPLDLLFRDPDHQPAATPHKYLRDL